MQLSRALREVAEILTTESSEAALPRTARLLADFCQACSVGILLTPPEGDAGEFWSGEADSLRPQIVKAVEGLGVEGESTTRRIHGKHGEHWLWAVPLGGPDGKVGTVAIVFDDESKKDAAVALPIPEVATLLATQISTRLKISALRSAKLQQERWFGVMDEQLRVLDRERQKFVAVVNQSDTFMIVVDRKYLVQWTNQAMAARLATSRKRRSVTGQPLQSVWDQLSATGPAAASDDCPVREAFRTGVVVHAEFHQTRDGVKRNLYLTVLPIKGPDGGTDEVLIMIQDLSDLDVLRRSEARYRLLFERSPDAMIMVDPATEKIVLANPVASELSGYPPSELLGLTVRTIHHSDDWEAARAEYERVFHEDRPIVSERLLQTKGDRLVVANMSATRFDLDGKSVVLVELQDITDRKRLEENLRHSHKMEAVGRLAGGVAHDFNNILTIIMGQSEVLVAHREDEERLQRAARSIHKAAMRGSLLTRQLLAFSRKEVLRPEVLDVCSVVRGIETMIGSLIGDAIAVEFDLSDEPCPTHADRGQLEQVIMNLAVNARDAMPDGGHLWIAVESVEDRPGSTDQDARPWVRLSVRDDGCGISEEIQRRLFEPFFTTKEQGKGTGLGLSSAYGIVRDSGGEIEVTSAPGDGATFSVYLPRAAAQHERSKETTVVSRLTEGSETILLVEDEEDLRSMAAEVLGMIGYTVLQAGSGEEAIQIWRSHDGEIDLLLTDVVMPGMSGGELVRQASPTRPGTKVLYMSGYTDDTIVKHGVFASAAAFIQKPFRLEALSRKVREVLDLAPRGPSRSVA